MSKDNIGVIPNQNTSSKLVLKRQDGTIIEEISELVIGGNLIYDPITNTLSSVSVVTDDFSKFAYIVTQPTTEVFTDNIRQTRLYNIIRGNNANNIDDGGGDIYDGGNRIFVNTEVKLLTDLTTPTKKETFIHNGVVYYFEENIQNFTEFRIEGNYGSDGSTIKEEFNYDVTVNGVPCFVVVNKQEQTSDPAIYTCMIMIGGSKVDFSYIDAVTSVNVDSYKYIVTPNTLNLTYSVANLTFAHNNNGTKVFTDLEVKDAVQNFINLITTL